MARTGSGKLLALARLSLGVAPCTRLAPHHFRYGFLVLFDRDFLYCFVLGAVISVRTVAFAAIPPVPRVVQCSLLMVYYDAGRGDREKMPAAGRPAPVQLHSETNENAGSRRSIEQVHPPA